LPKQYLRSLRPAFKAAEKGKIAVLGIKPRWPDTAYGYIEFPRAELQSVAAAETLPVKSFREKPDSKTAKKFFKAGHYFWNAGMFFWKAETVLDACAGTSRKPQR